MHIGGNIATSAGGPRCLKYGTTRDYILGLQVVLADGRTIRTGGKMIKIQTGYNLTQLFTGSEGTLGVITEATLRLIPKPRYRGTVMAVFGSLDSAAETVNRILLAGILPLALEMMDNACIRSVMAYKPFGLPLDAETILLIDQDGDSSAIVAELAEIARYARKAVRLTYSRRRLRQRAIHYGRLAARSRRLLPGSSPISWARTFRCPAPRSRQWCGACKRSDSVTTWRSLCSGT